MHIEYKSLKQHGGCKLEKTGLPGRKKTVGFEVAVIGGGLAGICAAVAAARNGAKTVLIQDRPVLGGNASSEIRVCVGSAHLKIEGKLIHERETGIIEEILMENRFFNPQDSYHVWDHILYNFVTREPNLELMMNTQAVNAIMEGGNITDAICWQSSTETEITVKARMFIDCSGDGLLSVAAGAPYRTGREAASEFDESYAVKAADGWQMGASLMLSTRDMGRPTPYTPPAFAIKLTKEDLRCRGIGQLNEGFWWIELGSDDDIVADQEKNRHLLMGYVHGLWDYIKNSGEFPEAANLALDWIGSVPGKRESRRFIGDYMLSQKDLVERRHFDDAVAYGGWSLDEHCPGGILSPDLPPSYFHMYFEKVYQIPFRSLYSATIDNLMFAGRNASQTHIALSSSRIIGTCATMGQATGTAAALCLKHNVTPRTLCQSHIGELQEQLLRDDAYIPQHPASGANDLAQQATISANSTSSGDVELLIDGFSRDEDGECHHWESNGLPAELTLEWKEPVAVSEVVIKLDTNIHARLWKVMKAKPAGSQEPPEPVPPELVKSLDLQGLINGAWEDIASVDNIRKRVVNLKFNTLKVTALRILFKETYGHPNARIFELRCYLQKV